MILGFKPRHMAKILDHTKIHTIREDKHRRWKPGMKIHFATGVRTKNYKQFKLGFCVSVQTITADFTVYPNKICVDGKLLSMVQKLRLVENDGFDKYMDLFDFFGKPYDYFFSGVIIHWTSFQYHDKGGFTYGKETIFDEVDELPEHLLDWMNVDWSKSEPPLRRPFKVDDDIKKPLVLTPIGMKKVTRKDLKEIQKSYKDDHAYDAIRYGAMLPKTEKKAGLFGRLIAWILRRFERVK